ncbi:hypothetical protein D3C76_1086780 [compost metagenome]
MKREDLVKQAQEAGQAAKHNLQIIAREPERMVHPRKLGDGVIYLNKMIKFAEAEARTEMKKDRLAGQSRLRTRLKYLVVSILTFEPQKGKEETA